MNLILLTEEDFIDAQQARVKGRVFKHLKDILKIQVGQTLQVGILNGKRGTANVERIDKSSADLKISVTKNPPKPSPIRLVLALPRPIVFKRLLPQMTALGIKDIVLLQTKRVEKSYWASPALSSLKMKEQMMLGLEQAKDTIMPRIQLKKRFKPFVEDEFKDFSKGTTVLLAHPDVKKGIPRRHKKQITLVMGPEGGFIPYEIKLLEKHGCQTVHMGERILKVETAVVGLISQLNSS